jgi:hypothetical protein
LRNVRFSRTNVCAGEIFSPALNILKELYELGFTQLYLLSGEHLNADDLPDYLVAIRKDKIDEIDF